ncbi:MAG: hypothetical protein DRI57_24020 [Deltaproteobacteria bacterium]|nr:MAG: hypothetical protein DRI57_24020 [Deltaproteobacteria bacterium]
MLKKGFPQSRHGGTAIFISLRHETQNSGCVTAIPRYPDISCVSYIRIISDGWAENLSALKVVNLSKIPPDKG